MAEARPVLKPVRRRECSRRWRRRSGTVVADALMHCGGEDKQTLWRVTEAHKQHGGKEKNSSKKKHKRCPWMCQIKSFPSRRARHERSSDFHIDAGINAGRVQLFFFASLVVWRLSGWQQVNLPTNTHKPSNPVSMQNTLADRHEPGFQQRPTMERREW